MRKPDFVIGEANNPYVLRWWIIPRNKWFNIYLHKFLRSDDPRALHDHPWWNVSIILKNGYFEVQQFHHYARGFISNDLPEWQERVWRRPGTVIFRKATTAHRIELASELPVWSLFITGRVVRDWGFLCPQGWKYWKDFVKQTSGGNEIGPGCDN